MKEGETYLFSSLLRNTKQLERKRRKKERGRKKWKGVPPFPKTICFIGNVMKKIRPLREGKRGEERGRERKKKEKEAALIFT